MYGRIHQMHLDMSFCIGEQNSQFRPSETISLAKPFRKLLITRQVFQRTIQALICF